MDTAIQMLVCIVFWDVQLSNPIMTSSALKAGRVLDFTTLAQTVWEKASGLVRFANREAKLPQLRRRYLRSSSQVAWLQSCYGCRFSTSYEPSTYGR